MLYYNRIPKTGSTVIFRNMQFQLKRGNNSLSIFDRRWPDAVSLIPTEIEQMLCNHSAAQLIAYVQHIPRWVPQNKCPRMERAVYINMLRDPVERVISTYYYYYHSPLRPVKERQRIRELYGNLSLLECALSSELCRRNMMTSYLAGASSLPDHQMFNLAMTSITSIYSFIGITEYMRESLGVLKAILPEYFPALSEIPTLMTQYAFKNPMRHDYNISHFERTQIAEANALDMQLYRKAKELFFHRLANCFQHPDFAVP